MPDIPRLNGAIRKLEQGGIAVSTFCSTEIGAVQTLNAGPYDALVFELEHNPYDIQALRYAMQFMLDRRYIAQAASLAPRVTPLVRVPANGGERNQFFAKQVLDLGVYGVIWPHVSSIEEAENAVAACRYPRPPTATYFKPIGQRGDGPRQAATYWGLTQSEYYARADVWPLDPAGELLVGIMCEDRRGIENLPAILREVPGIGFVLIGEGDLSQELGFPRQYDNTLVLSALAEVRGICAEAGVVCGHPHVDAMNADRVTREGYRWLMAAPETTYAGVRAIERAQAKS